MIGPRAALLPANLVQDAVRLALAEDLGLAGDITSRVCIPKGQQARLAMVARKPGIVAGMALAAEAFRQLDEKLVVTFAVDDGAVLAPGQPVLSVTGDARAILAAERTALNFVGRLSGVATLTADYVRSIASTQASIVCTRKTTPGLRAFEKHAVACGGGRNHRFGLFDAILIKDNHVAVAGGIIPALQAAKRGGGHLVKIEIEVDTLEQLDEVLAEGADVVLLDNMGPERLREAVGRIRARRPAMLAEASGGVSLETVAGIAATGVDLISVGALTHSAPVLDLGLDIAMA
ncbi:carboxylating nicotinate-nucleotide diphosphorylase [Rhabdaerophilum sp. SD176]|uniref:carboxylating nicotinate-nucleotide diphosphorylase n=1 Tax=Rhabdaerophilum sp. SD176 TaxID=2983548 RepID=UPI0024E017C7|nr:carboxylating nicotinate-nucleotide diphosphorylase [Rhabdaerophilum sp. SD176]